MRSLRDYERWLVAGAAVAPVALAAAVASQVAGIGLGDPVAWAVTFGVMVVASVVGWGMALVHILARPER